MDFNTRLLTYDGHRRVQITLNPDSLLTYTLYDGVGRVLERAAGQYGQLSTGKRLFRGADGSVLTTCTSATDLAECRHDLDTLLNNRATGSPSLVLQTFERDGESRVVATTSPEGRVTRTRYHDWGPVESVRVEGPSPAARCSPSTPWMSSGNPTRSAKLVPASA